MCCFIAIDQLTYKEPVKSGAFNVYEEPVKSPEIYEEPVKSLEVYEEPVKSSAYEEPVRSRLFDQSLYEEPIKTAGSVTEMNRSVSIC